MDDECFEIVSKRFGCCNSFGTYLARVTTHIKKNGELLTKYNMTSEVFEDQQDKINDLKEELIRQIEHTAERDMHRNKIIAELKKQNKHLITKNKDLEREIRE